MLDDEWDADFRKWWRWQFSIANTDEARAIAACAFVAGHSRAMAQAEIIVDEKRRKDRADWRILEDDIAYLTKKCERLERQLEQQKAAVG